MAFDAIEKAIFNRVFKRIEERKDSIKSLEPFRAKGVGIEGWLKVEVIRALEEMPGIKVTKINGKGADLTLKIEKDGEKKIELKSGTNFGLSYVNKAIKKYPEAPCLFLLASNRPKDDKKKMNGMKAELDIYQKEIKSKGTGIWIIGLVKKHNLV